MPVLWSARAIADIRRIRSARIPPYITRETQDRAARAIVATGNELAGGALLHPKLEDGSREKRVGSLPYLIIYDVPDELHPDSVTILSIWHVRQDRFGGGRR